MIRSKLKFGTVATGDRHTTESAVEILQEGGNAFDAALGALACACVSEPVLASLGAGGYLLATSPSNDPIL
ncbi:MAG: gamma-glutamyltransferase, partial [Pseudomonadota bacterium]